MKKYSKPEESGSTSSEEHEQEHEHHSFLKRGINSSYKQKENKVKFSGKKEIMTEQATVPLKSTLKKKGTQGSGKVIEISSNAEVYFVDKVPSAPYPENDYYNQRYDSDDEFENFKESFYVIRDLESSASAIYSFAIALMIINILILLMLSYVCWFQIGFDCLFFWICVISYIYSTKIYYHLIQLVKKSLRRTSLLKLDLALLITCTLNIIIIFSFNPMFLNVFQNEFLNNYKKIITPPFYAALVFSAITYYYNTILGTYYKLEASLKSD